MKNNNINEKLNANYANNQLVSCLCFKNKNITVNHARRTLESKCHLTCLKLTDILHNLCQFFGIFIHGFFSLLDVFQIVKHLSFNLCKQKNT